MSGVVSRKDFLRLGGAVLAGAVLAGAVLLGITGCGGNREVVGFLDATTETTALERTMGDMIQGFEQMNPNIAVLREAMPTEDVRAVIQDRLRSGGPPNLFSYDTGPGFGDVLAEAGLLRPLGGL